ncbi:MAG: CCA tRNA nucleotidyltransferase, partial [Microbacteriaceae bacterium]|nr:CCA tRNA nucleotidyltransferase [Microbacteriaceae bacterium]
MISVDDVILSIARTIDAAGGRALLVGGVVRDALLGFTSKDYDLEIYGLTLDQLETLLARYGHVIAVGRSFGVLRVKGIDADFSLPRRESKTGRGHRGFLVECDPTLTFEAAARRRDVTINSIGYDVLTEELLDPHGGQRDLTEGVLRATDPAHFGEDPLRALRVAQLTARFEFSVDPSLETLCSEQDLSELAHERIFEELRKLLVKGKRPSLGLEFLRRTTL